MLTIDHTQFRKLTTPLIQEDNAERFMQALEDMYGIKEMKPLSPGLHTDWDVYFVSPYAETFFRITYAEML